MKVPHHALTAEQLHRYQADGFLVLDEYFDHATVKELASAADSLLSRVGLLKRENPRVQLDQIRGELKVRQVWPVIDISETFARLAADERIVGLFRSLFDDEPVLFEDKVNYKHPKGGSPFPMHQDYSYWQEYSPQLTTAFVYIDEGTKENGCLEVVRGWHTKGLLPREEIQVGLVTDHHVSSKVVDPSLTVKVTGKPGTLVLFSSLTPHASAPNLSDQSRRVVIFTYNPQRAGNYYEQTSGANRNKAMAWR